MPYHLTKDPASGHLVKHAGLGHLIKDAQRVTVTFNGTWTGTGGRDNGPVSGDEWTWSIYPPVHRWSPQDSGSWIWMSTYRGNWVLGQTIACVFYRNYTSSTWQLYGGVVTSYNAGTDTYTIQYASHGINNNNAPTGDASSLNTVVVSNIPGWPDQTFL